MSKTELTLEDISEIKNFLVDTDFEIKEVAELFGISEHVVRHMCLVNTFVYIDSHLNAYLRSRDSIINSKIDKSIIKLYRLGVSYREISEFVGIHERNVIRRSRRLKTLDDDRCRLNVINRKVKKRDSLIRTLYNMGNDKLTVSNKLKLSRSLVTRVINKGTKLYGSVEECRGVNITNYMTERG